MAWMLNNNIAVGLFAWVEMLKLLRDICNLYNHVVLVASALLQWFMFSGQTVTDMQPSLLKMLETLLESN